MGARIIDLIFVRDRTAKRELKLLNALLLVCPHIHVLLLVGVDPTFLIGEDHIVEDLVW